MSFVQNLASALTPSGLLWTVIILSLATFLHELAHFALARWQGVAVRTFSVGMGPVLARRAWRGTEWRLSLLPLGGYVEIDGMAPTQDENGQMQPPRTGYAALPLLGKVAVILAGPAMNLLLAIGLMTALFTSQGVPVPDRARIEAVQPGSRAQTLGLQAGDVITAIDGRPLPQTLNIAGQEAPGWQSVAQTLKVAGRHTFSVTGPGGAPRELAFDWQPTLNGKKQLLGISYGPAVQALGVGAALGTSLQTTAEVVPQVLRAFGNLFGRFLTLNMTQDQNVSGPIGTAEIVSRAAALGPWALVQIAITLNLSLAFFNLIPIPGLDGGRILLALLGSLKGGPLSFSQEQAINLAGFAFVALLMMFVVVRDVSRFF